MNTRALLAVAGLTLAMGLAGCATEDFVRRQVGAVDGRVSETQKGLSDTQGQLAATQGRLDGTDKTAHDALDRATAAGKLAQGKFLYALVLSDDSVKFPVNGYELSGEAKSRLSEFAEKLKADNRNVFIEIQGHTDAKGSAAANHRIGEERAEAVRLFLNKAGVALNRMSTISYGAEAPVAPNNTRDGRAQNRRVVIIVLS